MPPTVTPPFPNRPPFLRQVPRMKRRLFRHLQKRRLPRTLYFRPRWRVVLTSFRRHPHWARLRSQRLHRLPRNHRRLCPHLRFRLR
ncbi:hypothetical protein V5E97_19945 [Singulisphaera sp. Ch08]|uniref:Uncharacterized protein n=1 Tax=Singulisphaera sp. Ch08 TaxID=3120278 RepID=A0AAU7CRJ3_9BACT